MKPVLKDLCFEIVQKCPNNCMFCSSDSNMTKSCFVSYDVFEKTMKHIISQADVEELSFSGGEPMLNPDLKNMIRFCAANNINTTLYTGGIVPRDTSEKSANMHEQKMIDELGQWRGISADEFKELELLGLNKVVFDLQAGEVDEYNALMGTKNNLANLLTSILHASYCGFDKSIHFIPNKINIGQFKEVLDLTRLAGIGELRVLRFVPQGRGRVNREKLELDDKQLVDFLHEIEKLKNPETKIKIGIPLTEDNNHLCTAGGDKLQIRFDGQVLPCPAFKDVDLSALEEKGFKPVNIYKNLEEMKIKTGINESPLCEQFDRFE